MRERRRSRVAKLGSHTRRTGLPFRRGWSSPWWSRRSRTPHAGWLGADLRPRPRYYAGDRAGGAKGKGRHLRLPWRREPNAPPVGRPLAGRQQQGGRRIRHPALLGLALVQGLFVGVAVWALTSPVWQVRHIQVEMQGADDAVVVQAVQALPLTGCNIFRCDLRRAAQLVEALPPVAQVEAHAVYPDGIAIVVWLRQPKALWRTGSGSYIVAADGVVLGALGSDPFFAGLR